MIKPLRVNIEMVQIPYDDLSSHVGEKIWFSPSGDNQVVHGPSILYLRGPANELFLSGREPINVKDIRLNTFWQPVP